MQNHQVTRRWVLGTGAAVAAGLGLAACGSGDDKPASSGDASNDPKAIAADAYTFGYPLVLMDATRAALGFTNQFVNATTLPEPDDRLVVRLNLDTLYSQAWLDLGPEPLVLQVPGMEADRYWLMQITDAWSNTRQNPSSIRPQTAAGATSPPFTYLVTGPGWSGRVPEGMTRLDLPTNTAWVLGRIQVNGTEDVPRVLELQNQLKLVPLSAWLRGEDAATGRPFIPNPSQTPPPAQVAAMDGPAFFDKLCALMAANPPAPADAPALERFATIGLEPGATVDGQSAQALNDGAAQAKTQIPKYDDPRTKQENGWTFSTDLGAYGTNYALRARTAMQALGANLAQDAVYPTVFAKADDGGAKVRYRLHFPAGQLPPVDAFWSLTAYDADSYLVPNAADIYAIGHDVPIVVNSDGTVDIAVQNEDPGISVPQGNWLPIPASGNFSLSMRLYGPKQEALDGGWKPPVLTPVRLIRRVPRPSAGR
ncbi:DUF1254 domain-containing protein [Nocardia crassostreae]|uniref:DUF1254 domain-containing protein n=1 Tax=Nocardia crassostreae TaxID=53428 RepID=UPI00082D44A3|nr:DUF1254 domain-containing protein [Nocardia crassostreae]